MSDTAQDYAYFNKLVNEYHTALERAEVLRNAYNRVNHLLQEGARLFGQGGFEASMSVFEQEHALRTRLQAAFPELGPYKREDAEIYRQLGPGILELSVGVDYYEQQAQYTLNRLESFVERTNHSDLKARLTKLSAVSREESRILMAQDEGSQQQSSPPRCMGEEPSNVQARMSNAAQDYVYFNTLVNEYRAALAQAEALREASKRLEQVRKDICENSAVEHHQPGKTLSAQKLTLLHQLKATFSELGPFSPEEASQNRFYWDVLDIETQRLTTHYEQTAHYTLNRLESFVEQTRHPDLKARLDLMQTATEKESQALTQTYEGAQREASAKHAQSMKRHPYAQRPTPEPLPRESLLFHDADQQEGIDRVDEQAVPEHEHHARADFESLYQRPSRPLRDHAPHHDHER